MRPSALSGLWLGRLAVALAIFELLDQQGGHDQPEPYGGGRVYGFADQQVEQYQGGKRRDEDEVADGGRVGGVAQGHQPEHLRRAGGERAGGTAPDQAENPDQARLDAWLETKELSPTYAMGRLR